MYNYFATVERVIDGDTVVVVIDLGFSLYIKQVVRLYGINAPEVVGASKPAGLTSKGWLEMMLPYGKMITIESVKPKDKYGRYLAVIHCDGVNINDMAVAEGHAEPAKY